MSFSELKGDAVLDAVAALLEPASVLMTDEEIRSAISIGNRLEAWRMALKKHKKAVTAAIAAWKCVPVDEYEVSMEQFMQDFSGFIGDPWMRSFFF